MGFAASGDTYTKRMDDVTAVVHDTIKIVDVTMLYEGSMEEWTCAQGIGWCVIPASSDLGGRRWTSQGSL